MLNKPNVIFILADDMGYGDLGVFGDGSAKTPNLDRLVSEGVCLSHYYTPSPVCAPARAGILTGRYPHRTGAIDTYEAYGVDRLSLKETTLADVLRANGCRTGLVGKWHLGAFGDAYAPRGRGFDEAVCFRGGWSDYYKFKLDDNGVKRVGAGEYLTDVFTAEAVKFIEKHAGGACFDIGADGSDCDIDADGSGCDIGASGASCAGNNVNMGGADITDASDNADDYGNRQSTGGPCSPFFLHVTYNAPHFPFQCPDEYVRQFRETGKFNDTLSTLYGMINCMDRGIGEIMDCVKRCGIENDTIIIFASDNGPQLGGDTNRYNCFLHGEKGTSFDGGIRVPAIVKWPGMIAADSRVHGLVHGCDWFPTLLEVCGIPIPENLSLDGRSALAILTNKSLDIQQHHSDVTPDIHLHNSDITLDIQLHHSDVTPDMQLHPSDASKTPETANTAPAPKAAPPEPKRFWQWNRLTPVSKCNAAVRDGKWKLVWPVIPEAMAVPPDADKLDARMKLVDGYPTELTPYDDSFRNIPPPRPAQLYNLEDDPLERNDLAASRPDLAARLTADFERWFAEVETERRTIKD